jgi:sugar lactone lactonase YvrE
VNREGTRLYVVDTGGVSNDKHRVQVFDALTGELIKTIGKRGNQPGDFNLPLLAATDGQGNLYVMDSGNFRVQRFSADGEFQHTFGKVGRNLSDFSRPKGIDTDRDGNIYVVDTSFGNFQIFNNEGQLLMFIGDHTEKNEPAKYILPADIEVDEDGRIYVVEQFFRRIDVFRPYQLKAEEGYATSAVGKK